MSIKTITKSKRFTFGRGGYGQLGLGLYRDENEPTLLMRDKDIQQIVCGGYHSFILKKSGELFAFGHDQILGLGHNVDKNKPKLLMKNKTIVCGGQHSFILKEFGELFAFGYHQHAGQLGLGDNKKRNISTLLMQDEQIRQIVCGAYHSFILKDSGELFAFGLNDCGPLG